jgi:hypothetical protein
MIRMRSKRMPATRCPLGPTSGRGPLKLSHLLRDSRRVLKLSIERLIGGPSKEHSMYESTVEGVPPTSVLHLFNIEIIPAN